MAQKQYNTGIILGRFQPFHKGHLEYLLQAYDQVNKLIVGIVTPGDEPTEYEPQDQSRFGEENNPFSYAERVRMIDRALEEIGMLPDYISYAHFRPQFIDEWYSAVPKDAVYFLTTGQDEASAEVEEKKAQKMRDRGLRVVQLEIPMADEYYSANDIRHRIRNEENWEHLVPAAVADFLGEIDAPNIIKGLNVASLRGTE